MHFSRPFYFRIFFILFTAIFLFTTAHANTYNIENEEDILRYNGRYFENQANKENYIFSHASFLGLSSFSFIATYVGALGVDKYVGGQVDFYENFAPVIGPLIAYFRYDTVITDKKANDLRPIEKVAFLGSSILQLISVIHFAVSLYDYYHPTPKVRLPTNQKNNINNLLNRVPQFEEADLSLQPILWDKRNNSSSSSKSGNAVGFNLVYKF